MLCAVPYALLYALCSMPPRLCSPLFVLRSFVFLLLLHAPVIPRRLVRRIEYSPTLLGIFVGDPFSTCQLHV